VVALTKIVFETHDGERIEIDVPGGQSVMRAAVEHDVPGIVAECGGNAACGTCHCFVLDDGGNDFPPPVHQEREMLEFVAVAATEKSRLSCQLIVPPSGGTIVVRLPENQL